MVLSFLAGLPAIVLGLLALRDIRRSAEPLGGQPLAMAGIATGTLFGVLCVPMVGMFVKPVVTILRANARYETPIVRAELPSFSIDVPFFERSPVLDGQISDLEYGPATSIDFTSPSNPGRLWAGSIDFSKTEADLSYDFAAAHTSTSLFLGVRVRDQVLDTDDTRRVWQNDSIEVFVDGDQVANDFTLTDKRGSGEGFQLIADVNGKKGMASTDFKQRDWKVASQVTDDGYSIEFEIPLSLIDTHDGPEHLPASTGSLLFFNVAINDQDRRIGDSDCIMWADDLIRARPHQEGEGVWSVGLQLIEQPFREAASK